MPDPETTSWDPIWEKIYSSQGWGKYPPEELIRFIAKNFYQAPDRRKVSLLEVGCGSGACVWFMAREGFSVVGLDGSSSAVRQTNDMLAKEQLTAEVVCGDATGLARMFPIGRFQGVVDICCLQHNRHSQIISILDQIYDLLSPGGRFFSMMVATESYGYGLGREIEPGTYDEISDGPLHQRGLTHFFTKPEIRTLLGKFANVEVDYCQRSFQNGKIVYKNWACAGTKPK